LLQRLYGWLAIVSNLKVFHKLLLLIVASVLFTVVIGGIGIVQTGITYSGVKEMYNERLMPVKLSNEIRAQAGAIEANVYRIMLSYDPMEQKELLKDTDKRIVVFNSLFEQIKNSKLDEEQRQDVQALETLLARYETARQESLDLELERSGNTERAFKHFKQNAVPKLAQINALFDEMADENAEAAERLNKELGTAYKASVRLVVAIIAIAAAVNIAIGLWISRMIVYPVRRLQYATNLAAQGDLTADVDVKSKDELGELARSFRSMLASQRDVLRQVAESSELVAASSEQLTASAEQTGQSSAMITEVAQQLAVGAERQVEGVRGAVSLADDIVAAADRMNENVHRMKETAVATAGHRGTVSSGWTSSIGRWTSSAPPSKGSRPSSGASATSRRRSAASCASLPISRRRRICSP